MSRTAEQEAGCSVHVATSAAFDCNAALSNFFSGSARAESGDRLRDPSVTNVESNAGIIRFIYFMCEYVWKIVNSYEIL